MKENKQLRVCVIGAGTHFLSGISYYTIYLANTLAQLHKVSVILMRQLVPARFYPGRKRVGMNLSQQEYDPSVRVFNGVDWYWLPSMIRTLIFLIKERPDVLVFQWWSGTVLHSYLLLALAGRLLKAQVIIEFHEVLDTGEAKLQLVQAYVRVLAPFMIRLAHGFVIHSEYDRKLLQKHYNLEKRPNALIPHGPYNHYQVIDGERGNRIAPASCCNLLFFGVIRPFKGLEDLITAFDALPENEIDKYWLTIVGETWEGWTKPTKLIEQSRYRERITFINHYVPDEEVAKCFSGADAVVLPYHRSSTSGPLHIAMSYGLPVVVTNVGGLIEAVSSYDGAILVPPGDPASLQRSLLDVVKIRGKHYLDSHTWQQTAIRYQKLIDVIRSSNSLVQVEDKEAYAVAQNSQ